MALILCVISLKVSASKPPFPLDDIILVESFFYGMKCHIVKSPFNVKECSESHTRVQDGSFNFVNKFVKGCFSGGALCETILPLTAHCVWCRSLDLLPCAIELIAPFT